MPKTYCDRDTCSLKYEPHKHPSRVKAVPEPEPAPEPEEKVHIQVRRMNKRQAAIKTGDIDVLIADLSDAESMFVELYMTNGFKGSQAVRDAGYKCKNAMESSKLAYEMLRRPTIKAIIDHRKAKMIGESPVSPDYVLRNIVKIVEKTSDDETKSYSPSTALRGLELLAKHLGMFIERTEISGRDGEAIQLQKVQEDSAELSSAIARLASRARKGRMASEPDTRATGTS